MKRLDESIEKEKEIGEATKNITAVIPKLIAKIKETKLSMDNQSDNVTENFKNLL